MTVPPNTHASTTPPPGVLTSLVRVLQLSCPRCGRGAMFETRLRMRGSCPDCRLSFVQEAGFYLGSIYFNYGMTVSLVVPTFMVLVLGFNVPRDVVLWPSALFTILFPLWFFRYARAMWLSVAFRVNSIDFPTDPTQPSTCSDSVRPAN